MIGAVPPSRKSHMIHQSNCNNILGFRFEIEGKVGMVAPQDSMNPRSINKALFGLNAKEQMDVMKDEMDVGPKAFHSSFDDD